MWCSRGGARLPNVEGTITKRSQTSEHSLSSTTTPTLTPHIDTSMEGFLADVEDYRLENEPARRQLRNAILDAPEPGPGYPSHDDVTRASRLMGILRPIEDDIKTRARAMETSELIEAHKKDTDARRAKYINRCNALLQKQQNVHDAALRNQKEVLFAEHKEAQDRLDTEYEDEKEAALKEQKRSFDRAQKSALQERTDQFDADKKTALEQQKELLGGDHDAALQEQKEQLTRDRDDALQKQKEQLTRDRDNALQTEKKQLTSDRDDALQKQKKQLEEELRAQLNTLKDENTSVLQALREELAQDKETCLGDLREELEKRQTEALGDQKEDLESEKQTALRDLQEELDEKHSAANRKLQEDLEKAHSTTSGTLREQLETEKQTALQELRSELNDAHSTADSTLREQLETEKQTALRDLRSELNEAHSTADSTLREQLETEKQTALQEHRSHRVALEQQKKQLDDEKRNELQGQEKQLNETHATDLQNQKTQSDSQEQRSLEEQQKRLHEEQSLALETQKNELDGEKRQELQDQEEKLKDEGSQALQNQESILDGQKERALDALRRERDDEAQKEATRYGDDKQAALDALRDERDRDLQHQKTQLESEKQEALDDLRNELQQERDRDLQHQKTQLETDAKLETEFLRKKDEEGFQQRKSELETEKQKALDQLRETLVGDREVALQNQETDFEHKSMERLQLVRAEEAEYLGTLKSMCEAKQLQALRKQKTLLLTVGGRQQTELQRQHTGEVDLLQYQLEGLKLFGRSIQADSGTELVTQYRDAFRSRHALRIELDASDRQLAMQVHFNRNVQEQYNGKQHAKDRQRVRELRRLRQDLGSQIDAAKRRGQEFRMLAMVLLRSNYEFSNQLDESRDANNKLDQDVIELTKDKKSAESEVDRKDVLLQTLRKNITTAAEHIGFKLPADTEPNEMIKYLVVYGKPFISRMYRVPFEQLSRRLNIPIGQWPSFDDLLPQEHNDAVASFLTNQLDSIVKTCNAKVDAEQLRTFNVRCAWLNSKMEAIQSATNTISGLKAQLDARGEFLDEMMELLSSYLDPGGHWDRLVAAARHTKAMVVERDRQIGALEVHIETLETALIRKSDLLRQVTAAAEVLDARLRTSS